VPETVGLDEDFVDAVGAGFDDLLGESVTMGRREVRIAPRWGNREFM